MIKTLKTSISFAKNLFTVGAFKETQPETVTEICSKITSNKKLRIIEFGMGHGNMTKQILKTVSKDSEVYSFEINADFCSHVQENIKDSRLKVINDSALNFKQYVLDEVDNFIISIPFTFLKNEEAEKLVKSCFSLLKKTGVYSQVVYRENTLLKVIGNKSYEKKIVKAIINEKIYHIKNS
jgi:phospholipid N-methyltransferase